MTATTCCTPKPLVYQIQVIATRSQFSSILSRTTTIPSSTASATVSIPELHPYIKVNKIARNDVNNNNFQKNNRTYEEILSIPNDNEVVDNISEAEFLAMVGLRHRTRKKQAPISLLRPLAKRLAGPICLLPLPKHSERVRQALYILLPFLKFLSITHDVEPFCAVNNQTQTENLSTRLVTQIRTPETMYTKSNKRKVSKAGKLLFYDTRIIVRKSIFFSKNVFGNDFHTLSKTLLSSSLTLYRMSDRISCENEMNSCKPLFDHDDK